MVKNKDLQEVRDYAHMSYNQFVREKEKDDFELENIVQENEMLKWNYNDFERKKDTILKRDYVNYGGLGLLMEDIRDFHNELNHFVNNMHRKEISNHLISHVYYKYFDTLAKVQEKYKIIDRMFYDKEC